MHVRGIGNENISCDFFNTNHDSGDLGNNCSLSLQ